MRILNADAYARRDQESKIEIDWDHVEINSIGITAQPSIEFPKPNAKKNRSFIELCHRAKVLLSLQIKNTHARSVCIYLWMCALAYVFHYAFSILKSIDGRVELHALRAHIRWCILKL